VARDVAGLERDATAAIVIRNVVLAYWDTRLASEELEILNTLTESARQQLLAVEAAISVEKQPPSASAEVKVAAALRQDAALSAEQALRSQSADLARLLGVEVEPRAAPWTVTDRPDVVPADVSFEAALATAMDRNPQLAAVRARGRTAALDVDVRRNGMLPAR
jgi:outer membrane protein TolC